MSVKNKAAKGSAFERDVCRTLSLWWTKGKRDDVFWRTSGSGARATARGKKQQTTYGQYGDIQAIDPIGEPLLKIFTLELKKGYNKITASSMMDLKFKPKQTSCPLLDIVYQAYLSYQEARSETWALIHQRDRRETLITFPKKFKLWNATPWTAAAKRINYLYLEVTHPHLVISSPLKIIQVHLSDFLKEMSPQDIWSYVTMEWK